MSGETQALRVAFGETLVELAACYPDFLLLDGDLASSTRTDILHAACPDRFLEMGIAEQNMTGVAAGLRAARLRAGTDSRWRLGVEQLDRGDRSRVHVAVRHRQAPHDRNRRAPVQ